MTAPTVYVGRHRVPPKPTPQESIDQWHAAWRDLEPGLAVGDPEAIEAGLRLLAHAPYLVRRGRAA